MKDLVLQLNLISFDSNLKRSLSDNGRGVRVSGEEQLFCRCRGAILRAFTAEKSPPCGHPWLGPNQTRP